MYITYLCIVNIIDVYYNFPFLENFIHLFERGRQKELASTDSIPKCPQWLGLDQTKARSQEVNSGSQANIIFYEAFKSKL